jgi:hypothetical protein
MAAMWQQAIMEPGMPHISSRTGRIVFASARA